MSGATGALGALARRAFRRAGRSRWAQCSGRSAARGLLYVDPRPGAPPPPGVWGRSVDVIVDEPAVRPEIEAKLAAARADRARQGERARPRRAGAAGHGGPDRRLGERAGRAGHRAGARERPGRGAAGAEPRRDDRTRSRLPYRPNVGAVLFNPAGLMFVARRADLPNAEGAPGGWQLPQGGMDEDEDPRRALMRELAEEIGTDRAEIIGEHPEWLTYDLPAICWASPWAAVIAASGSAGSRCASRAGTRTSGSTSTRIRNSTPGAGRSSPNSLRWRSSSSGRSTRYSRAHSRCSGPPGDEARRMGIVDRIFGSCAPRCDCGPRPRASSLACSPAAAP